ncbi:MAG: SHOCT-like domain-containing protein [Anaerolineae bacterium]
MSRQVERVEVESCERVILDGIAGDAKIEGWSEEAVEVRAAEEATPRLEVGDGDVTVSVDGDCVVRIPRRASLEVHDLPGDLRVIGVAGGVALGAVSGDVALRDVGPTRAAAVAGDFSAKSVDGDLHVGSVAADAVVRQVAGALTLKRVGADLFASDVAGDVKATAGADAALFLTPTDDVKYKVVAGADLKCVLPEDVSFTYRLSSGAGAPRICFPGVEEGAAGGEHRHERVGAVGDGGAAIDLTAGADLVLTTGELGSDGSFDAGAFAGLGADFEVWADDFANEVANRAEVVAEHVGERLRHVAESMPDILIAAGLGDRDAQRIAARVESTGRKAAERAARHAERAARHAEKAASRAAKRAEQRVERQQAAKRRQAAAQGGAARRSGGGAGRGADEVVTAEERLTILRMVEEGKLSVDEAERLLQALEDSAT